MSKFSRPEIVKRGQGELLQSFIDIPMIECSMRYTQKNVAYLREHAAKSDFIARTLVDIPSFLDIYHHFVFHCRLSDNVV